MNKKTINIILLFIFFFLFSFLHLQAQNSGSPIPTIVTDSTDTEDIYEPPSPQVKSARKAALWALLPGAGQVYNKQYWKAPIFMGGIAGFATLAIQQRSRYKKLHSEFTDSLNLGILPQGDLRINKQNALTNYKRAIWGASIFYTFSILDAYAHAQLRQEIRQHSPLKAAYFASVLPGLGQIYNKKYWKVPIVYGGFALGGGFIIHNLKNRNKYRDEWRARNWSGYGERDPELVGYTNDESLLSIKNFYKKNMDVAIIGTCIWYVVTILDATIDAHLSDFDISDDLSLQVSPYLLPSNVQTPASGGLNLSFRF